jgi:hypothetical protein
MRVLAAPHGEIALLNEATGSPNGLNRHSQLTGRRSGGLMRIFIRESKHSKITRVSGVSGAGTSVRDGQGVLTALKRDCRCRMTWWRGRAGTGTRARPVNCSKAALL